MYKPLGQKLGYWQSQPVTDEQWMLWRKQFTKQVRWHKKYAWIPHLINGKFVWFNYFFEKHNNHYVNGKLDTIGIECYTMEDYIERKLMGEL